MQLRTVAFFWWELKSKVRAEWKEHAVGDVQEHFKYHSKVSSIVKEYRKKHNTCII